MHASWKYYLWNKSEQLYVSDRCRCRNCIDKQALNKENERETNSLHIFGTEITNSTNLNAYFFIDIIPLLTLILHIHYTLLQWYIHNTAYYI